MTAQDLLKELERDFHLQLSGSRLADIGKRLEGWASSLIKPHAEEGAALANQVADLSLENANLKQQLNPVVTVTTPGPVSAGTVLTLPTPEAQEVADVATE